MADLSLNDFVPMLSLPKTPSGPNFTAESGRNSHPNVVTRAP
jgi:hypothetical protein